MLIRDQDYSGGRKRNGTNLVASHHGQVPLPGVPKPPAPVTGTRTSSVYRPPQPPVQESASPKEDFPKRNVNAEQNVAPKGKGKGRGSSTTEGSAAPAKGTPRGSIGRAMSFLPEDRAPRRGNIPKDLLGPPLHTPPSVPAAHPKATKLPTTTANETSSHITTSTSGTSSTTNGWSITAAKTTTNDGNGAESSTQFSQRHSSTHQTSGLQPDAEAAASCQSLQSVATFRKKKGQR